MQVKIKGLPPIKTDNVYADVKSFKRTNDIKYSEMDGMLDFCHTGYLCQASREGITIDKAQKIWDEFYGIINSPGYFDYGGGFDKWFFAHRDKSFGELRQNTLEEAAQEQIENYKMMVKNRLPKYIDACMATWQRPMPAYDNRAKEAMQIFNEHYLQIWTGPTRRGKTMLAVATGMEASRKNLPTVIESWGYFADLFASHETVDRYGKKRNPSDHIKHYHDYQLLIIDEYTGGHRDNIIKYAFELINKRIEKRLKTIIITNETAQRFLNSFDFKSMEVDRRVNENGRFIDFSILPEWDKSAKLWPSERKVKK